MTGPGAVLPEPGDRAGDDLRVAGRKHLIAEAQPLHHLGPEILQHHVALLDKAQEGFLRIRLLEVERDGLLAGIHGHEGKAHQAFRHAPRRDRQRQKPHRHWMVHRRTLNLAPVDPTG